jgi:hypothetical protein
VHDVSSQCPLANAAAVTQVSHRGEARAGKDEVAQRTASRRCVALHLSHDRKVTRPTAKAKKQLRRSLISAPTPKTDDFEHCDVVLACSQPRHFPIFSHPDPRAIFLILIIFLVTSPRGSSLRALGASLPQRRMRLGRRRGPCSTPLQARAVVAAVALAVVVVAAAGL